MRKYHEQVMERPETIICAAIWVKDPNAKNPSRVFNVKEGIVFAAHRHWNCFGMISLYYGFSICGRYPDAYHTWDKPQGFLTSKNRFVDRVEAAKIAVEQEQIPREQFYEGKELFSEDLY